MLHVPVGANSFGAVVPNVTGRPAAAFGTAVTPTANSEGAWTQIFSATSWDSFGILVNVNSNTGSAASRNTVLDIGIDEAGGTSYIERVSDLVCAGASAYNLGGSGVWYYFPLFIPAGSSIAVRGNSTVATAFRVYAQLMQKPANPAMVRKGSFVETLGVSGNAGTVFVPGATFEGAWTLVGTTTKRCWWWQVGVQLSTADTSWTAGVLHVDVAVGDGTNFDVIIQDTPIITSTAEALTNIPITAGVEWDVPAGSNIYVRGQFSASLDVYQAAVYGLGG